LERSLELSESVRRNLLGDEVRALFLGTTAEVVTEYAQLLASLGRPHEALHVIERGKARAFADLLTEAQAEVRRGVDPELRERQQEILAELLACEQRLEAIGKQAEPQEEGANGSLDAVLEERQRLRLDLRVTQAELRRRNPRYADLAHPEPYDLDRIRRTALDPGTVLLEYSLGADQSLLVAVTEDRVESYPLPPRHELEGMVRELRDAVVAGLDHYPQGRELHHALIEPAAALIEDRDLLVVPEGALHYLPFALLLTESRPAGSSLADLPYVIRDRAIRVAPSATVAVLIAEERPGRPSFDGEFAAYADPVVPAGLEPIPDTADEVWSIADAVGTSAVPVSWPDAFDDGGVRIRTGAAATKEDVLELTSGETSFRYLHLATHGILNSERPDFSGLTFASIPDDAEDPFWRTFEIFNARIPSDVVVLSACATGLGQVIHGEGVVGLTRAFLYAGASAVAVSLWKVADESTPWLMRSFYEALAEQPVAQALRTAQLAALDGPYGHPFHWAPFVVVGALPGV
jgi:CHAT domain-containing protein